ncbi:MAG TPA: M24 family metallopeptidase [Acidimicrobiales bacterium]|jgi:Xaa-Pro aminopeptidase|nr:M24 family metallopeptidase [Acidimicrobiales bacterium]
MAAHGVDVVVLCGENNVAYATGHVAPSQEPARAGATRSVAVVTPTTEHLVKVPLIDFDDGARELVASLADYPGTLAIDEYPSIALRMALDRRSPDDARPLLTTAKFVKTPAEVEAIRRAQRINEMAMDDVLPMLRPGMRDTDLTALFFRRVFELGATGSTVDPIWNVVPNSLRDAPFTFTGHLPFPLPSTGRLLDKGDVIFNDTGIDFNGWASDYGRTWCVGVDPDARQRSQFHRYLEIVDACCDVIKPGASAWDVAVAARRANDGDPPWLPHFYVAHGIGTESAELPFCGTDLGEEVESQVVFEEGTVLVLEPVVWDDGHGGYRAEEVVVVTADGCELLTEYPHTPYE